jgi:hypothetical protein
MNVLVLKVTFAPDPEGHEEDAADIAIRGYDLRFCEIGPNAFLVKAPEDPDELEVNLNARAVGGTYQVVIATNQDVRDAFGGADVPFHN